MSNYITANRIQTDTDYLFQKGIDTGTYVGFNALGKYYNVKRGSTTYIAGIPSHGKSEFMFELLMSLSTHYGWKHALFTPETGSPVEIVAELAHKHIGRPFVKNEYQMSIQEKYRADAWISEYFYLLTPNDSDLNIDGILKIALEIKREQGLDTLCIDPFNELNHDYTKFAGREDKYLENTLGKIRRFARENDIHVFIVAHPKTLQMEKGIYLPPTAFQFSGGAAWYAKAESILCVYRPDMTSNVVEIHVQKSKPKHTGQKGIARLYWDWKLSRYYEVLGDGTSQYTTLNRITQPKANFGAIEPNNNFYESTKDEDQPF